MLSSEKSRYIRETYDNFIDKIHGQKRLKWAENNMKFDF